MSSHETSEEFVEQGLAALELADFEDAIEIFGRAAVEDSTNARAWFYLGLSYLETSQVDLAAEALNRAITAEPDYADAHYLLGTAAGAMGQLDRAAQSYRRALATDPHHHKAEEFLIRTEALLSSRQHYRTAIGVIYADQREPNWLNTSVRELLQSAAIFKDSPATRELARLANGIVESRTHRPIDDTSSIEGPFWTRAIERAEWAFDRKRWPEAAASYHEALDLSPDHAFIHHSLGLIYFMLGDIESGTNAWQRAADLDPDYDFSAVSRMNR